MIDALSRLLAGLRPAGPGEPIPINRRPSRLLARAMPWLTTIAGSLAATLVWVASAPVVPPFGLMVLIAWCQLRPRLLPVWAGLPLGLADDLYSGQPLGSAVVLWSAALLALDAIEARIPWRGLWLEWLVAAALLAAALLLGAGIVDALGGGVPLTLLAPQIGLTVLLYPLVARTVAACDRLRLLPFIALD